MITEKDLTTYCGIYCGDCPRYKAKFADMCVDISEEFERSHFSELAQVIEINNKEFQGYDKALLLLKSISSLKCNAPCRLGSGKAKNCEVIKCNKSKNIDGCWDCDDFEECKKLDFLKHFCGDAPIKNIRKIKKYGVENWATHREKQYPWL
ncbi:MAG: DUF3795 domain-containing protein [Deltaproteobacteria bacterium]|nr:DUF3795 domain-containing protein [Deltaproteobacteria bacterium]